MKNYWHEPTCQQYNHEWCAEEKGHSWGPRHYVEEQLSSLARETQMQCSSEHPGVLHNHVFICLLDHFFFFLSLSKSHNWYCNSCNAWKNLNLRGGDHKGTHFIPCSFELIKGTSLKNWMTEHRVYDCGGKAGKGLWHKCGAACLSVCSSARPSCLC